MPIARAEGRASLSGRSELDVSAWPKGSRVAPIPRGSSPATASAAKAARGLPATAGRPIRPQVWSPRDQKTLRKTFRTLADARAWRAESKSALRLGTMRAPTRTTLARTAEDWLSAAKAGVVRTRSGEPYKPSALRAYEQVLRRTLLPELGHLRLSSLTRNVVQDQIDRLVAQGLSPSTVRNTVLVGCANSIGR
jgi:hypothetical protein